MEILERLETIFEDTFVEDNYNFSIETTNEDIGEWDSLNQVRLLMAIEQEFGIRFELEEMERLISVKAIADLLSDKT